VRRLHTIEGTKKEAPAPSTRAPRSEGPRPLRRRGGSQTHCCRLPGSRRWRGGTAASAVGTPRARTHTSPDTDTARVRVCAGGACQVTCPLAPWSTPPPSILFSAHTQARVSTSGVPHARACPPPVRPCRCGTLPLTAPPQRWTRGLHPDQRRGRRRGERPLISGQASHQAHSRHLTAAQTPDVHCRTSDIDGHGGLRVWWVQ
jgi:hypothetical protein